MASALLCIVPSTLGIGRWFIVSPHEVCVCKILLRQSLTESAGSLSLESSAWEITTPRQVSQAHAPLDWCIGLVPTLPFHPHPVVGPDAALLQWYMTPCTEGDCTPGDTVHRLALNKETVYRETMHRRGPPTEPRQQVCLEGSSKRLKQRFPPCSPFHALSPPGLGGQRGVGPSQVSTW